MVESVGETLALFLLKATFVVWSLIEGEPGIQKLEKSGR